MTRPTAPDVIFQALVDEAPWPSWGALSDDIAQALTDAGLILPAWTRHPAGTVDPGPRPTAHEVIRRALVTPIAAPWTGTAEAAAIAQALTDAGHLQPPWHTTSPDGRRWQVVHPDIVDPRPLPLDQLPLHARLVPLDVDSGGIPVGRGGEGSGT